LSANRFSIKKGGRAAWNPHSLSFKIIKEMWAYCRIEKWNPVVKWMKQLRKERYTEGFSLLNRTKRILPASEKS
jgi:hypothetical protein